MLTPYEDYAREAVHGIFAPETGGPPLTCRRTLFMTGTSNRLIISNDDGWIMSNMTGPVTPETIASMMAGQASTARVVFFMVRILR